MCQNPREKEISKTFTEPRIILLARNGKCMFKYVSVSFITNVLGPQLAALLLEFLIYGVFAQFCRRCIQMYSVHIQHFNTENPSHDSGKYELGIFVSIPKSSYNRGDICMPYCMKIVY